MAPPTLDSFPFYNNRINTRGICHQDLNFNHGVYVIDNPVASSENTRFEALK